MFNASSNDPTVATAQNYDCNDRFVRSRLRIASSRSASDGRQQGCRGSTRQRVTQPLQTSVSLSRYADSSTLRSGYLLEASRSRQIVLTVRHVDSSMGCVDGKQCGAHLSCLITCSPGPRGQEEGHQSWAKTKERVSILSLGPSCANPSMRELPEGCQCSHPRQVTDITSTRVIRFRCNEA